MVRTRILSGARLAILSAVLAFAGVVVWRWPAEVRGPIPSEAVAEQQKRKLQAAQIAPTRVSVQALRTADYGAEPSMRSDRVVPVDAASLALANIVPLFDDSGESVAWRIAPAPAAATDSRLVPGHIIVAINGRGLSVGGASELVRALGNGESVGITLAEGGMESALAESATTISVSEQLATDSVKASAPDCRLNPSQFRSADDYRRAVYVMSLRENTATCSLPSDWQLRIHTP